MEFKKIYRYLYISDYILYIMINPDVVPPLPPSTHTDYYKHLQSLVTAHTVIMTIRFHSLKLKFIQDVEMAPSLLLSMGILSPTLAKLALQRWMLQIEMPMLIMDVLDMPVQMVVLIMV